jgi:hypothetical protein
VRRCWPFLSKTFALTFGTSVELNLTWQNLLQTGWSGRETLPGENPYELAVTEHGAEVGHTQGSLKGHGSVPNEPRIQTGGHSCARFSAAAVPF